MPSINVNILDNNIAVKVRHVDTTSPIISEIKNICERIKAINYNIIDYQSSYFGVPNNVSYIFKVQKLENDPNIYYGYVWISNNKIVSKINEMPDEDGTPGFPGDLGDFKSYLKGVLIKNKYYDNLEIEINFT